MIGILLACAPKPTTEAREPFRFAVVGDRTDEPDDVGWRAVWNDVAAWRPDLVVTVGDLVDDATDPADWDEALAATTVVSAPIELTPGNHDILDDATAKYFRERTGQAPWRSFDRGGIHFVVVDNSIAETWEQLSEEQRTWLEADLDAHATDRVVVLMHKPFWATGPAAVGKPDPMHALFVKDKVDAVFTGHWHAHAYQIVDGIPYVLVGTSGGAYHGFQDVHLGNAYEWVGVTMGDEIELTTHANGTEYPIDIVTLADNQRLHRLDQGAVAAVLDHGALRIHVENVTDVPIKGDITVYGPEGPTWFGYDVAPGAVFDRTGRAAATRPLPRIVVDYPLPDAGPVQWKIVPDIRPAVEAPFGSATIDGLLDEWTGGFTDFTDHFGNVPSTDRTAMYLRHDADALYFAARCDDANVSALHRLHHDRDGQVVYDDRIGMMLAPEDDQLYWFYVNPNGAVWDLHVDRTAHVGHKEWDAVEAAATIDASGWSVEAKIPFAALGLHTPPDSLAFDVRRRQVDKQAEATLTTAFGAADPKRFATMILSPDAEAR